MATPSCSSGTQAAARASGVNPSDPVGLGRPHVGVAELEQPLVPAAVLSQTDAVEGDGDPVAELGPGAWMVVGHGPRNTPFRHAGPMTEDGPTPTAATQPELPLRQAVAAPGSPASRGRRLDARTRAIGRQGVAAARARLAGPTRPGAEGPTDGITGGHAGPIEHPTEAGGHRGRAA